jgi:M6 family metalloprotease-like protein
VTRSRLFLFVGVVGTLGAVLLSSPLEARRSASCTYEQKQSRTASLVAYKSRMARDKAAYFKTHRSTKQRAAFVKAQQKKLKALQGAATCSVPALPPSSNATCSPQLAPGPGALGLPSEGPLPPGYRQHPIGRDDAVILFIDYPDVPGLPGAPEGQAKFIAPDPGYFDELSNGRFSVTVTPVTRWIRMPAPVSAYLPIYTHWIPYAEDAIRAADPFVDFSQYDHVTFWSSSALTGNPALSLPAAGMPNGITVDGTQVKFGNFLAGDIGSQGQNVTKTFTHELLHTLGLPDLGGRAVGWDPLSVGSEPPSLTHLLGWHKWLLGWLDPPQLTCLSAPGTVEETLTPMAVRGGKKLVVIPISDSYAYAVEARKRIGFDKNACGEGVLVYAIDSTKRGYEDPIILEGPPRCGNVAPGAFSTGGVHEDQHVKVEVLAQDGRNYRVRVTRK